MRTVLFILTLVFGLAYGQTVYQAEDATLQPGVFIVAQDAEAGCGLALEAVPGATDRTAGVIPLGQLAAGSYYLYGRIREPNDNGIRFGFDEARRFTPPSVGPWGWVAYAKHLETGEHSIVFGPTDEPGVPQLDMFVVSDRKLDSSEYADLWQTCAGEPPNTEEPEPEPEQPVTLTAPDAELKVADGMTLILWNPVAGAEGYLISQHIEGEWIEQARVTGLLQWDEPYEAGATYVIQAYRGDEYSPPSADLVAPELADETATSITIENQDFKLEFAGSLHVDRLHFEAPDYVISWLLGLLR